MFRAGRTEEGKRAVAGHLAERRGPRGMTRARVPAARIAEVALVTPRACAKPRVPASATKTQPATVAEGLSLAKFAERADQQLDREKKLALRRNLLACLPRRLRISLRAPRTKPFRLPFALQTRGPPEKPAPAPLGGARLARPLVLRDLEQLGDGTSQAQARTSLSAVPTTPVLADVAVNGNWLLLWRRLWRNGRALRSSSLAARRNRSPVSSLATDRPFQCLQLVVTQIRKSAGKHHYHRRTALPSCGTPQSVVVRGGTDGTIKRHRSGLSGGRWQPPTTWSECRLCREVRARPQDGANRFCWGTFTCI